MPNKKNVAGRSRKGLKRKSVPSSRSRKRKSLLPSIAQLRELTGLLSELTCKSRSKNKSRPRGKTTKKRPSKKRTSSKKKKRAAPRRRRTTYVTITSGTQPAAVEVTSNTSNTVPSVPTIPNININFGNTPLPFTQYQNSSSNSSGSNNNGSGSGDNDAAALASLRQELEQLRTGSSSSQALVDVLMSILNAPNWPNREDPGAMQALQERIRRLEESLSPEPEGTGNQAAWNEINQQLQALSERSVTLLNGYQTVMDQFIAWQQQHNDALRKASIGC